MKLFIAGGCGDEGRNCFYVEGESHAFFVDAGTSTDGFDRMPDVTAEEIRKAEYLLITHSHKDHTGAIEYLVNQGFQGMIVMSNQTYRQIHYKPLNTMILDSTAPELELAPGLRISWGRTGHCAGAVWYDVEVEGKNVFFSGDYRENDPFYRSDPVRHLHADMAVIDGAYSRDDRGPDMRENVREEAGNLLSSTDALLLPVPHYGRGLSMAVYFHEKFKDHPFYFSKKLHDEWIRLGHRKYFANDNVTALPFETFRIWDEETIEEGGIYFLTDAQLSRAKSHELIHAHDELSVLLTGSIHGYGNAKGLYESGRAKLALWPNHMTLREMEELKAENDMTFVIPFHNKNVKAERDMFEF